jgi:hypothetical protein
VFKKINVVVTQVYTVSEIDSGMCSVCNV